jgi:hypothetical protein
MNKHIHTHTHTNITHTNITHLEISIEVWPSIDLDSGKLTWGFLRFNCIDQQFRFLPFQKAHIQNDSDPNADPKYFVSRTLRPWIESERHDIFDDFLNFSSLYSQPHFGNCLWTTEDLSNSSISDAPLKIFYGWLEAEQPSRDSFQNYVLSFNQNKTWPDRVVCRSIFQPPRLNQIPITFLINVTGKCDVCRSVQFDVLLEKKNETTQRNVTQKKPNNKHGRNQK